MFFTVKSPPTGEPWNVLKEYRLRRLSTWCFKLRCIFTRLNDLEYNVSYYSTCTYKKVFFFLKNHCWSLR